MMRAFEHTVFLRSFNYLRVTHAYALRYNWIYPLALGVALTLLVATPDSSASLFKKGELISAFVPVFSVISPFYIAALAAIATFSGGPAIDRPFEMSQPVLLEVIGGGGDWEKIDITPRHFLSLLFGYCTTVSILLLGFSIFAPLIGAGIAKTCGDWSGVVHSAVSFVFLFLSVQLVICTLVGVYFLSDKLHRR